MKERRQDTQSLPCSVVLCYAGEILSGKFRISSLFYAGALHFLKSWVNAIVVHTKFVKILITLIQLFFP
jgi:hypothetical protein